MSEHEPMPRDSACPQLGPQLWDAIARLLPPNEVATNLRLVCKDFALQLRDPSAHATVTMSQPVPPSAFASHWATAIQALSQGRISRLACLTATSGSIPNLTALRELGCALPGEALRAAATAGQLDSVRWLHLNCSYPSHATHTALEAAARAGHMEVCRYLHSAGCKLYSSTLCEAARGGHRGVVEWLLAEGCPLDGHAAGHAARGGHVVLLDVLLQRHEHVQAHGTRARLDHGELLAGAAAGCDLVTLQRLHVRYVEALHVGAQLPHDQRVRVVCAAARSRTADWRDKVAWLAGDRGYPRSHKACVAVAEGQDGDKAERLAWLKEAGFPLRPHTLEAAVGYGRCGAAVEYLLGQGVEVSELALWLAAWRGDLVTLRLLYERRGGALPYRLANAAAEMGRLEVLKWMAQVVGEGEGEAAGGSGSGGSGGGSSGEGSRGTGSGWGGGWGCEESERTRLLTADVMRDAAASGGMELMAWLVGRGCPRDERAFVEAAAGGSELQLRWMAAQGFPLGVGFGFKSVARIKCRGHARMPAYPGCSVSHAR